MNQAYHDLMMSRIRASVDAARAAQAINHPGLKGRLREIVISELLTQLLPSDIGLGTGTIVTTDNCQSKEVDVVMFDKSILPPILYEQKTGIFPVESVLYTIEIKSSLTASELKDAHAKAKELENLNYSSGIFDAEGHPQPHQFAKLIPCVFAFDSDLRGPNKSELERYDEVKGSEDPVLTVICVVGKGYWHWHKCCGWTTHPREYELAEVAGFIAGTLNTYRMISRSRHDPRLGNYILT